MPVIFGLLPAVFGTAALGTAGRFVLPKAAEVVLKHAGPALAGFMGARWIHDANAPQQSFEPTHSLEKNAAHGVNPKATLRAQISTLPSESVGREVRSLFDAKAVDRFQRLPDLLGGAGAQVPYPSANTENVKPEGYRAHNNTSSHDLRGYSALNPQALDASKHAGSTPVDSNVARLPPKVTLDVASWNQPLEANWFDWLKGNKPKEPVSIKDHNPLLGERSIDHLTPEQAKKILDEMRESPITQRLMLEIAQSAVDAHQSKIDQAIERHNDDIALLEKIRNTPLENVASLFKDGSGFGAYKVNRAIDLKGLQLELGEDLLVSRLAQHLEEKMNQINGEHQAHKKEVAELKAKLNIE